MDVYEYFISICSKFFLRINSVPSSSRMLANYYLNYENNY